MGDGEVEVQAVEVEVEADAEAEAEAEVEEVIVGEVVEEGLMARMTPFMSSMVRGPATAEPSLIWDS